MAGIPRVPLSGDQLRDSPRRVRDAVPAPRPTRQATHGEKKGGEAAAQSRGAQARQAGRAKAVDGRRAQALRSPEATRRAKAVYVNSRTAAATAGSLSPARYCPQPPDRARSSLSTALSRRRTSATRACTSSDEKGIPSRARDRIVRSDWRALLRWARALSPPVSRRAFSTRQRSVRNALRSTINVRH